MVICSPPSRQPQRPTATNAPPADVYVPPFTILYDTREQAPWTFANIVIEKRLWVAPRKLTTLNPGDYSIEGMERLLCVERKSSADFVGSVITAAGRNVINGYVYVGDGNAPLGRDECLRLAEWLIRQARAMEEKG